MFLPYSAPPELKVLDRTADGKPNHMVLADEKVLISQVEVTHAYAAYTLCSSALLIMKNGSIALSSVEGEDPENNIVYTSQGPVKILPQNASVKSLMDSVVQFSFQSGVPPGALLSTLKDLRELWVKSLKLNMPTWKQELKRNVTAVLESKVEDLKDVRPIWSREMPGYVLKTYTSVRSLRYSILPLDQKLGLIESDTYNGLVNAIVDAFTGSFVTAELRKHLDLGDSKNAQWVKISELGPEHRVVLHNARLGGKRLKNLISTDAEVLATTQERPMLPPIRAVRGNRKKAPKISDDTLVACETVSAQFLVNLAGECPSVEAKGGKSVVSAEILAQYRRI